MKSRVELIWDNVYLLPAYIAVCVCVCVCVLFYIMLDYRAFNIIPCTLHWILLFIYFTHNGLLLCFF